MRSSEPVHALTADLDDDGRLDMVVTASALGEVHVHLGRGDGSFGPAIPHPVGDFVWFAALGDFDEDGRIDLAVADHDFYNDQGVAILLGIGNGTFGVPTRIANSHGAYSVAVGDFDNDQHLDLVTPGGSRDVFFGNGDGSFGPGLTLLAGVDFAAAGDFNGDGADDVASSRADYDEVKVYLSNGTGNFSSVESFATCANPGHLVARDINDDDVLDLVVARSAWNTDGPNDISVLVGHGDGTFEAPVLYVAGHDPVFVAVSDVNSDGPLDLVFSNLGGVSSDPAQPSTSVLLGTGDGAFADAVPADSTRYGGYSIAVADCNGDGIDDLVKPRYWGDDVGVLLGNGDGTFELPDVAPVGDNPRSIVAGDLDGDGRLDLVTANHDTHDVSVLLATGAGSFAPESRFAAGVQPAGVAIGELTGDGVPDLAVANRATNDVSVLSGNGDGSFSGPTSLAIGTTFTPSSIAVGDFDDDDARDLVVTGEAAGRVAVFLGNGDGTFEPRRFFSVGSEPSSVVVEDFDGDDVQDLAVSNFASDTISILLGEGDGTFTQAPSLDTFEGGPLQLAVGDVDDDLHWDLVVVNETSCGSGGTTCGKPAQVYPGNGDGTFALPLDTLYFPGGAIAVLDVDGDGHLDLVGGSPVSLWLGDGDAVYEEAESYAFYGPSVAGGDLNLDGRMDLVVANEAVPILLDLTGPKALVFDADGVTLVWPAATGALTYNVYRGHLADLVDLDSDGLPDNGYGSCRTGLDDDPRDVFFVDTEVPAPAGAGFFYLMSVVDAGGEGGLGTTSAGLPRIPESPCP